MRCLKLNLFLHILLSWKYKVSIEKLSASAPPASMALSIVVVGILRGYTHTIGVSRWSWPERK